MVNWTQGIDDETLSKSIDTLKKNNNIKMFIVDKFIVQSQSYPYCHDWSELLGDDYQLMYRTHGFASSEDNRRYVEFWKKRIEEE